MDDPVDEYIHGRFEIWFDNQVRVNAEIENVIRDTAGIPIFLVTSTGSVYIWAKITHMKKRGSNG